MMGNNPFCRRRWVMLALAALLLASLALRYRGIAWAALHPDEPTIAAWAHWTEEHPYISERFYAGGFFQLVKPAVAVRTWLQEWEPRWQAFLGDPAAGTDPATPMVLFLRMLNAWFAALTVLIFFALGRRVSGSSAAGLAAAAFLALSRLHVDHSHYAETDIAMLLTLSAALALWARVQDGASRWGFLLAAFVSGWAIGTKFTTGVLLFSILVGAATVSAPGRGGLRWRRACAFGAAGWLLCLAAVIYTNQGIPNLRWFVPQVRSGLASVYAERSGLLNRAAEDSNAVWLSNWNTIRDGLGGIGWGWLAFMAVGLCRAAAAPYRRFWPVTLMFPALYGAYCLFFAPWIRGQEFLALYAVFAAWLAIGLREVAALARRSPCPRLSAALVVLAVGVSLLGSGIQACRSASQFGIPDPRLQALGWLATHAPLNAVTAVESYTTPAERLFSQGVDIGQIERTRPQDVADLKIQYLLRNVTSRGRGSVDPHTRELYPDYAANLRAFQARARVLCRWGHLGDSPYAFAGHRIEWWEVLPAPAALELAVPLYRPLVLDRASWVFVPAAGNDLGGSQGLWVDRNPHQLVVNGPAPDHRTLYVVLQTVDRAAEVTVRLAGGSGHATLGPYDVAVVPVRRPVWKPRFQEYDVVEIKARPQKNIKDIPCYAEIAFTPAEAAQRLYQKGYPDRALAVLKAASAAGPAQAWLSFVCAVQEGDWALASRVEPAARALLAQLEQARTVAPEDLLVNGHTGRALAQHRRVRLPLARFDRATSRLAVPEQTLELTRDPDRGPLYQMDWHFPVRLAAGRYRIAFTLHEPSRASQEGAWALTIRDNTPAPAQRVSLTAATREPVIREVTVNCETDYDVNLSSETQGGRLEITDVEIQWGDADLLRTERLALQKALIRHCLHRGDGAGAGALLAAARAAVPEDFGLDRLELEWRQVVGGEATNVAAVARRVLRTAPFDWAALTALGPGDEAARTLRTQLKDGAGAGLTLYPWLRIVRLAAVPGTGRREVVFEALRDDTPVLRVQAWRQKDRRNASFFSALLCDRMLQRGERVRMEIPPAPETGSYTGTWITVSSPAYWLAVPLPVPGLVKGRIPLP